MFIYCRIVMGSEVWESKYADIDKESFAPKDID